MKTIRLHNCVTTGLDPALASAQAIEIEESPLGQGGFGIAYAVHAVDGRRVTPQVAKILLDNGNGSAARSLATVHELQRRLGDAHRAFVNQGKTLIGRFPALRAVPQLSFEGELDGRPVRGYCAANLVAAGFDEFARVLDGDRSAKEFQASPLRKRLGMALQLVEAFEFLSSQIRFIHADIKAEALFVDVAQGRIAIIDFDSGALARDPSDTPTTFGTKQDWLAPEILRQLDAASNGNRTVKVDLLSDVWAVNIAIHYLLVGAHPLFFLTEFSDRSIRDYFCTSQWPDVSPSFKYFRKEYAKAYAGYAAFLKRAVSHDIVQRLAFTINQGYESPHQRTSYGQWRAVLQVLDRPQIKKFEADRTVVDDSRPLRLSWMVTGSGTLELSGHGDVTGRDSISVRVTSDTTYRLTMKPSSGAAVSATLLVRVDDRPARILSFTPTPAFLARPGKVTLAWSTDRAESVRIEPRIGDVTGRTDVKVMPKAATAYTLVATNWLGRESRQTVQVGVSTAPPTIQSFRTNRTHLADATPAELTWDVLDAETVHINGIGKVPASGSQAVAPRSDTAYELVATSYFGASATASIAISTTKQPPIIARFEARQASVRAGMEAELNWSVRGGEQVEIVGVKSGLKADGSILVAPTCSTEYVLRAKSYFGVTAERKVQVAVIRPTQLDTSAATQLGHAATTRLGYATATQLVRDEATKLNSPGAGVLRHP